jgi:hypothetical protein
VSWNLPNAVVDGEAPTAFQHAAMVADLANMVGNWGDAGIQFINADLTLALARLPVGTGIGLAADHRVEDDGASVATAVMFDRAGPLGSASSDLTRGWHTTPTTESRRPAALQMRNPHRSKLSAISCRLGAPETSRA